MWTLERRKRKISWEWSKKAEVMDKKREFLEKSGKGRMDSGGSDTLKIEFHTRLPGQVAERREMRVGC
jgi:hypothetical protein